ncbi:major facilitator superfamily domain-containing protein [Mariannaea sp. PMI_226]|nr:major facilitator superfamily domain-containing protein [Mariannaea sp. PMI_226]
MEKTTDNSTSDVEAGSGVEVMGEEPVDPSGNVHPRDGINGSQWILTCVALFLGALLYGLDTTIAADVQAQVYEALGHIEKLPWVGLGFPMASVVAILPFGRAYALFDLKTLVVSSICVFEIGSAICGAAPTSNALIIGRAIAGIGGAGMYLGALTYTSTFTTPTEAPLYNALTGLSWGVGCILGPVIGGAFSVSSATWRWAFYINLPLAGIIMPIYLFIVPTKNPRPDLTIIQKLGNIDWIGAGLYASSFVLFVIVLTFGGSTYAWDSTPIIVLWVVFGVCLIAFVLQQGLKIFTNDERRLFPVHFLKSRTLILLYITTGSAGAAQGVVLYYTPLFFQFTRGDSPLQAAVRLLPFICTFIFFVMAAGGTLSIVGRYNFYYIIGGSFITIGGALLCTTNETTSTSKIYGYEALTAIGIGLLFQIGYAVAGSKVIPKDVPKAIGFINVGQIGTIAISLAIAGSLFQNVGFSELKRAFDGEQLSDDYIRSALAGTLSPVFSSDNKQLVHIAVVAVAATIRKVYSTVAAAGALIVVSSLLMRFEKLDLSIVTGG